MKILKKAIFKTIFIASLIIGGGAFIIYLPKIFGTILVKSIDWLTGGVEPKYDENGKMIYDDGRHTVSSFGKRNQFAVEKYGAEEITWDLFDRDKNDQIDVIRFFTKSSSTPHVYTLGEKGYTKLNYETAEVKQSKNMKDFSEKDRLVFERLENLKAKAENDQEKHEVAWK